MNPKKTNLDLKDKKKIKDYYNKWNNIIQTFINGDNKKNTKKIVKILKKEQTLIHLHSPQ